MEKRDIFSKWLLTALRSIWWYCNERLRKYRLSLTASDWVVRPHLNARIVSQSNPTWIADEEAGSRRFQYDLFRHVVIPTMTFGATSIHYSDANRPSRAKEPRARSKQISGGSFSNKLHLVCFPRSFLKSTSELASCLEFLYCFLVRLHRWQTGNRNDLLRTGAAVRRYLPASSTIAARKLARLR